MMRIEIVAVVGLLSLQFVVTANAQRANDQEIIVGRDFRYLVPASLGEQSGSIFYPNPTEGDTAKSTSVLVMQSDVPNSDLVESEQLHLLLFWDKNYEAEEFFLSFAEALVEKADFVSNSDGIFHYRDSLGTLNRDFYANFNPAMPKDLKLSQNYYIKSLRGEPAEVAGVSKKFIHSCTLNTVEDGIAAQVSTSGSLCTAHNFDKLYEAFRSILQNWRIK